MKTIYLDGEEYQIPLEEWKDSVSFIFAAEYDIPSGKAKKIIEELDLWDMLEENYGSEIASCFQNEKKYKMRRSRE